MDTWRQEPEPTLDGWYHLDVSATTRVLGVIGFYIVVIGLVSYNIKDRAFISDALIALSVGIAFGPIGANWINIEQWTRPDDYATQGSIVYEIMRIVLGIQVLFTGISLPKAYMKHAWRSVSIMLGPVMIAMWLIASVIIYGLVPSLTYAESLVIGACITPTDPVLAASIVKGRFAEEHVRKHLRDLISAESGANDGLGFPFIYLGLYLVHVHTNGESLASGLQRWIVHIWIYDIALSIAMGIVIGYLARKSLKYAEKKNWIDHENFLGYGVGLTFFSLAVVGVLGSDDLLCAFVVGNSFTWDDWFRKQTEDHSFQDVIDILINSAVFIFIGTLIPWSEFQNAASDLTIGRLFGIGILVMLFRRLPWVIATYKFNPAIENFAEAVFTGWFGPIGVGAVYYTQVALRELPAERENLRRLVNPIVYFIILCSVVGHGLTLPIIKHTPRAWYHASKQIMREDSRMRGSKDPLSRPLGSGQKKESKNGLSMTETQTQQSSAQNSNNSNDPEHDESVQPGAQDGEAIV